MKNILLLTLTLTISSFSFGQDTIYPEFKGGEKALHEFLGNNINYPSKADQNLLQGLVYVNFRIDTNGSVLNAQALKGIGYGCDEEALRVINLTDGMWSPCKINGKKVTVSYSLPIRFIYYRVSPNAVKPRDRFNYKGKMYFEKKQYRKAIKYFQFTLQIDPNDLTALHGLASVFLEKKKTERACIYLQRGKSLKDQDMKNLFTQHCN